MIRHEAVLSAIPLSCRYYRLELTSVDVLKEIRLDMIDHKAIEQTDN